jgi:hypothetical protein
MLNLDYGNASHVSKPGHPKMSPVKPILTESSDYGAPEFGRQSSRRSQYYFFSKVLFCLWKSDP